jgi:hypothetical protein
VTDNPFNTVNVAPVVAVNDLRCFSNTSVSVYFPKTPF